MDKAASTSQIFKSLFTYLHLYIPWCFLEKILGLHIFGQPTALRTWISMFLMLCNSFIYLDRNFLILLQFLDIFHIMLVKKSWHIFAYFHFFVIH